MVDGNPGNPGDLVDRARAGDKRAFEELLRPVIGSAARLAFGMVQDREEAEDVVQEASLKAWRHLGMLREGSQFSSWFFGIVANECRSVLRRPWRRVLRFSDAPWTGSTTVTTEFSRNADLRHALMALTNKERAAILLHFYMDQPLDQVAASLQLSVAGVKSRINRALRKLRPALRHPVEF
jgi:RNA polymerase sigma-70 factor, ECF subfamily